MKQLEMLWGRLSGYLDSGARPTETCRIEQGELLDWMGMIEAARITEWQQREGLRRMRDQMKRATANEAPTFIASWIQTLSAFVEILEGYVCANCGSKDVRFDGVCRDCSHKFGDPVPDGDLCSICRQRHGPEKVHPCE